MMSDARITPVVMRLAIFSKPLSRCRASGVLTRTPSSALAGALAEIAFVKILGGLADLQNDRDGFVAVPVANGQEQAQEMFLHAGRDAANHAQIEQGNTPIVCEEDVAGMRVSVKEAFDEDL